MDTTLHQTFRHHKWFKGGTHTVEEALDYFAKSGCYLDQKKKKASQVEVVTLFQPANYDNVIRSYDYRDRATYTLNEVEKAYFLERVSYWNSEREREQQEWAKTEIVFLDEVKKFLWCHSDYSLRTPERELAFAKKRNDAETILFWENELKRVEQTRNIIDGLIAEHEHVVKTNEAFATFKELVNQTMEEHEKQTA